MFLYVVEEPFVMYDKRRIFPLLLAASRTLDISYLDITSGQVQGAKCIRRGAFHRLFEVAAIKTMTSTLSEIAGILLCLVIASI